MKLVCFLASSSSLCKYDIYRNWGVMSKHPWRLQVDARVVEGLRQRGAMQVNHDINISEEVMENLKHK